MGIYFRKNWVTVMNDNQAGLFDRYFYDRNLIEKDKLLFSGRALKALLIPLILEQFLGQLMGVADMMMVSRVGSSSISAVSNVDQLNILVIQVFSALATGAVIICSQYLGRDDRQNANRTAGQVVLTVLTLSMLLTIVCLVFAGPLLNLLFGSVEKEVMEYSVIYFYITAASFPFLALFCAGAAFFRAEGNAKFPMKISIIGNCINIAGNAVLIFVFDLGVKGAAISTLFSRVFCMAVVFYYLRKPRQIIVIRDVLRLKPDFSKIKFILAVGIPAGIENGMFQFGKLAIQSSVATLSTDQMAAQAMAIMLEGLTGMVGIGIGIGMMTVVGQAIGAGRFNEARYYIVKLTSYAFWGVLISSIVIYAATPLIIRLGDMNEISGRICMEMMLAITIVKPFIWAVAFVPAYGIRAAGDVSFSMISSTIIMWTLRVALCIYLIRVSGFGPIAVWIAMFVDWTARALVFSLRFISGKWLNKCTV